MRSTGQAMVWDVSLCLIMISVAIASLNMQVGAARADNRRKLMDAIAGFISIDCGLPAGSPGYIDGKTSIVYSPDEGFTEAGENNIINREVFANYLKNVRSFPTGERNCYTLKPKAGKNNTYLIRAIFFYGNYDSKNSPPSFYLYLGTNWWDFINLTRTSYIAKEIVYVPSTNYIDVCLVNTNSGVPFISALELRLLNNTLYKTKSGLSLDMWQRSDYGASTEYTTQPIRYKDDIYDRFWYPVPVTTSDLVAIETPLTTDEMSNNDYKPPPVVMRTAVTPSVSNAPLVLTWNPPDTASGYYVYLHFFEVNSSSHAPRQFSIYLDDNVWLEDQTLPFSAAKTIFATAPLKGVQLKLGIWPTTSSAFPPLLNALEIYIEKDLRLLPTTQQELVDAMMNIKKSYKILSNWQGDPCLPKQFLWDGLKCNYDQDVPTIISLNLSQHALTGEVAPSFSNLTSLESLDLSNNSLSGTIPEFLAQMPSLKKLNLAGNNFKGAVPHALLSKNGSTLTLSVGENPNLCVSVDSVPCQTKKKKSSRKKYIIAASVVPILALVVSVVAFVFWRRKISEGMAVESDNEVPLRLKKQSFTYSEIASITNNFKTLLGKGGSGEVFLGSLDDHTEVAVKRLYPSVMESSRQFQTEVDLLSRIHHVNLVTFLGYCNKGSTAALIYEYMVNGSLEELLSDENAKGLTWKGRLQIAQDAAQGLEYLHKGCTPSILHGDLKPANILLNENWQAKISDFGVCRIFEAEGRTHISVESIAGTIGYFDPEIFSTKQLSEKSDVYSFGVVLLELITGKRVRVKDTEGTHEVTHIKDWVRPLLKERNILKIIDSRLEAFGIESATLAIETAVACVSESIKDRPDLGNVLAKLKQCLALEYERASRVDGCNTGPSSSIEKASAEET